MYVHWQSRTKRVITELGVDQAELLMADLKRLTEDAGYSTRLVEILLANIKEVLPSG